MGGISVLTTVGTEQEANLLAEELIDRRQAACVNIISGVRSVFRWQGSICKESEYLLVIKTLEEEFEQVRQTIHELHTYDVPEVVSFPMNDGDPDFLGWMGACVDKHAQFDDDIDEEAEEEAEEEA
jgi:periplasmic divalent cation tolerance protein